MKETKETEVVEETTSQAFGTMIDYVYDKDSRWEGKNVMELFEIANAADYYDVSGMMEKVTEVVAKVPINLATVVYLASIAELFSTMFNDVSQILLDKCASFLSQTLLTHVLDFSGLFSPGLFSPQHASTALRLHNMMEMPMPCTNCKQFLCQDTLPVPQDVHPGCIVSHPESSNPFIQWKVTSSDEEGNVSLSVCCWSRDEEKENIAVSGMTYCCTVKLIVVGPDILDNRQAGQVHTVKWTDKLGKFMKSYSEMVGVSDTSLRFVYLGQRIYAHETPSALEMEKGDYIDVSAKPKKVAK
eukprot:GFUD01034489.1.p1 GENE.GFUD01034489.1~~GFUD01034489.1.p1  ORF type:complete len:300 (-),score=67.77 GFUD01034489.1:142-1041(-)